MGEPTDGRLPYHGGLDGLRAVAVVAVLVYHGDVGQLPGGYLGVDVFFVLSGFLITSLLVSEAAATGSIDLRAFWLRRFRRLLPALLFVLVGVAGYAAFIAEPSTLPSLRLDAIASLFYVANWRFVASGSSYFEAISAPSPVRHLWSLAVEEQWYLVWPFVCAALLPRPHGRRVLGAVIVAAAAGSIVLMSLLTAELGDPSRAYYGTDSRAHTLLIGSGLALLLWRHTSGTATRVGRRARLALSGGAVAATATTIAAFVAVDDQQRWMYRGGFAAMAVVTAGLITAAVALPWFAAALSVAPLRWIGQRSYAMYLWHWPLGLALSASRLGFGGWARFALLVATTAAVSDVSLRLIENPVRRGRIGIAHPVRLTATASAAVAIALLAATTGATPPPDYAVVDTDDPVILEPPSTTPSTSPSTSPSTTMASSSTTSSSTTTSPPRHPTRVALVGDSVAYSIQDELGARLVERGIAFGSYAVPGCGVVTGFPIADDGSLIDNCVAIPGRQHDAVRDVRPDLVVLFSAWETSDRVVDGVTYRQGTPEFAGALGRLYDEALTRVRKDGAQAVFVLQVPSSDGATTSRNPSHDARLADINRIMIETARRHRGSVTVVSITDVVCPIVPCPNEVSGVAYRGVDGSHFEMPGAAPVAVALADRLAALDLDALPVP